MFGRRGMDVLALCETKMKGKGEVAFGEVTGRVSGVERGRAREGVALLLSEWMVNKVVEWKEVSSRLMWVRVRMGRECWAFVSAYGPVSYSETFTILDCQTSVFVKVPDHVVVPVCVAVPSGMR